MHIIATFDKLLRHKLLHFRKTKFSRLFGASKRNLVQTATVINALLHSNITHCTWRIVFTRTAGW